MENSIKALVIFEMLGRPAGYLKETLIKFIDKISQEEGIEIVSKKIHEPKRLEKAQSELFTTFSEVEMNFKNMNNLFKIIFVYMPSHIEIISPEELRIKNFDLNTLANELARRLHQYDEIAKRLNIEREILQRQLQQQDVKPAIRDITSKLEKTEKKPQKKGSRKKKTGKK